MIAYHSQFTPIFKTTVSLMLCVFLGVPATTSFAGEPGDVDCHECPGGSAGPPGAEGPPGLRGRDAQCCDSSVQFIGFSQSKVGGAQGIVTLTQACDATYPSSRICSTEEIVSSTIPLNPLSGSAWVRPAQVRPGYETTVGLYSTVEAMTCEGWSNINERGLTMNAMGQFKFHSCFPSNKVYVACCKTVKTCSDTSAHLATEQNGTKKEP